MDIALYIKNRLKELGLGQRDLARAANVTESYISQLLSQKKLPPAPNRSGLYDKIGRVLKLPHGQLAKLAQLQRRERLKKRLGDEASPLLPALRELVLRKCQPDKHRQVRTIFEKQPLGELERFVMHKLLSVVQNIAGKERDHRAWMRRVAELSQERHSQMRVALPKLLNATIFDLSNEHDLALLNTIIASWDIDLHTFAMEIVLNRKITPGYQKTFEFVERGPEAPLQEERGLREFLQDASLSGDASADEIAFLRTLRFAGRQPTPLYYYREVQSLRDPLHFRIVNGGRT